MSDERARKVKDYLSNVVVKDNDLIQKAKNDLTLNEQKLINFMISLIKPGDKDFQTYKIKMLDFAKLTGIDKRHIYREFKKIIESIESKAFWFENEQVIARMHWVIKPKYIKEAGVIELKLDPDIKRYLIGLQGDFTKYELYNILSLKSKYSVSLYELFKSYSFKSTFTIKTEELKENIGADIPSYKYFGMFREKVLERSINDINEYTDLDISYQCLDQKKEVLANLQGHKVAYIRFIIKNKQLMDKFTLYQRETNRVCNNEQLSDQVPHQISLDIENETTALFDDTTNQQIN